MKKIILLSIVFLLSQTACSQNQRQIDWDADLDFLAKELSEKHYNFFTVHSKNNLSSSINTIKSETENLNDFQIAVKTQQLIAKFGDSHTTLNFTSLLDKDQILPLYLSWFSDGLHILGTSAENKELLGCRIISINEFPIERVVDSLSTLITIDNQAIVKSSVPPLLSSLQILECFGFAHNKEVILTLKTEVNRDLVYALKATELNRNNRAYFEPDSLAFSSKNEKIFFTESYYPDEQIYYMMYNECWSKELELQHGNKKNAEKMPSFKEFEEKAFNTLNNNPVKKIVFDLRYNQGRNSTQGRMFIEKLAKFLETHSDMKVFVVVGRKTFSSAILNAMDFKRLTNAIFVGEETSGKPNHFGEIRKFQLPNSKLYVNYSTKYFKRTDQNLNTITPDVKIETSFSDFVKGVDPVYQWIKEQ